ncbi:Do family serine endopeptidase [Sphingomonas sp. KR1UV-12]|uniref:Probable periplasmic serine endoprotease DegP-like n=1 Tax=Sphingomonas aurea TaxID=3063994 RepID=A0ABT9ENB2_9SPHN|nr:Do family serine endopeptidase [Sphingomonas sp. KR1UV-12]MDP1028288.1 Do family serine endopeptidase [Sphingomonas sp. KR1UV-12]
MRYAYAITGALLLGGATATLALQPTSAQTAQNEPGTIQAAAPRPGAPMSFADMVAKLQPAVVNISTKQSIQAPRQQANPFAGTPFENFFGQMPGQGGGQPQRREGQSLGSGFIISADGYVVTNNHVVAPAQGATVESITVTLPDRKEYTARLIGRDEASDLALLKIDAKDLPYVKFGDSARARAGDWVVAIGNPFGLGGTVTAGIVSAVHRVTGQGGAYDRFIQTDASINQGNSGGPMFNLNGDVIGINSQIFSQSGGNIGIGFAIPAEEAKPIIAKLMSGQKIQRGYLGVTLGGPVDDDAAAALGIPKNQGELIAGVTPDGPAGKGGLRPGDVVTRVNGKPVTPDNTLSYLVANVQPGETAKLDVLRNGRAQSLNVTVAARPTDQQLAALTGQGDNFGDDSSDDTPGAAVPAASPLGLTVQPLTPQIARQVGVDSTVQGVVVAQVDPASDAGSKLRRGDVVSAINGTPVRTAAEVASIVQAAKAAGRPQVLMLVQRGRGNPTFVPVRVKS